MTTLGSLHPGSTRHSLTASPFCMPPPPSMIFSGLVSSRLGGRVMSSVSIEISSPEQADQRKERHVHNIIGNIPLPLFDQSTPTAPQRGFSSPYYPLPILFTYHPKHDEQGGHRRFRHPGWRHHEDDNVVGTGLTIPINPNLKYSTMKLRLTSVAVTFKRMAASWSIDIYIYNTHCVWAG